MVDALIDLSNVAGIVGVDPSFEGTGRAAIKFKPITFFADSPSAVDASSVMVLRRSPSGGTAGNTNSAFRIIHQAQAGTTTHEWALLSEMRNYANSGENVAGYLLGEKHGSGATWGAVIEVEEMNSTNNPTTGTVGCEIDVTANGTDSVFPYGRVGVDLAIRKGGGAASCQAGWGFRIQNGGDPNSIVRIGYGYYPGMKVADAFDCSHATVLSAALKMPAGASISFDGGYQHLLKYDSGGLGYYVAGTLKARLNASGSVQTPGLSVANLPPAGNTGNRAFVTDATSNIFNTVVAGGGSNRVPVFDDGGLWRVG